MRNDDPANRAASDLDWLWTPRTAVGNFGANRIGQQDNRTERAKREVAGNGLPVCRRTSGGDQSLRRMKLLFDESLSPRLVPLLRDLFPESESAEMGVRSDAAETRMEARANRSPVGLREPANQAHYSLQQRDGNNLKQEG